MGHLSPRVTAEGQGHSAPFKLCPESLGKVLDLIRSLGWVQRGQVLGRSQGETSSGGCGSVFRPLRFLWTFGKLRCDLVGVGGVWRQRRGGVLLVQLFGELLGRCELLRVRRRLQAAQVEARWRRRALEETKVGLCHSRKGGRRRDRLRERVLQRWGSIHMLVWQKRARSCKWSRGSHGRTRTGTQREACAVTGPL